MSNFQTVTAAAEAIVAPVFHLLTGTEAARMMSSLEIDLTDDYNSELRSDPDGVVKRHAIARALRTLHRTRMQAETARTPDVDAQLAEIEALILTPQPVRANAHLSPAASAAEVVASWFSTAHVASAPLMFRTRVESPVL